MELLLRKVGGLYVPLNDEARQAGKSLPSGRPLRCAIRAESSGTVPMLRTWRGWMAETAKHMAAAGCVMPLYIDSQGEFHGKRPFNADDAHELFTSRWLGVDENGHRYSWSLGRTGETRQAPKSKRLFAMDKHLEWATERGIKLTIPRNSEYEQLSREQER